MDLLSIANFSTAIGLIEKNDLSGLSELLNHQPEILQEEGPNGTLLQHAAEVSNHDIIAELLDKGADVNGTSQYNVNPPIFITCQRLNLEGFLVLYNHQDIEVSENCYYLKTSICFHIFFYGHQKQNSMYLSQSTQYLLECV